MYVKLKNINKTFGNHNEWNDLSFVIEKGKLIGILGSSDSGKTTILRILVGLEYQDLSNIYKD